MFYPLAHLMLSSADVRRELVTVLAAVATDVTLKRLAETVTSHVNSEHDVVQEENATVAAVEGAHWPTISVQHLHGLPGGERGEHAPLY